MKQTLLHIHVKEVTYGKETYLIGTSDDLGGFFAEGKNMEELDYNINEVVHGLLYLAQEREKKAIEIEKKRKFLFQLSYMWTKNLSLRT